MSYSGVISRGVRCPIIREGDNIKDIVIDSLSNLQIEIGQGFKDRDVVGITESIVARAYGNYVTVDEIANELDEKFGYLRTYILVYPIYSRNRFSMILKAIARSAGKVVIYMPPIDEVGNPSGVNRFTGINMKDYYTQLVNAEGKQCVIHECSFDPVQVPETAIVIYCGLHDYPDWQKNFVDSDTMVTLADICSDRCEYGLLGSNKATDEKLKLFPSKETAQQLVDDIQKEILQRYNKHVEVMVYGDGCFKDPVGGIWEFADPVVSPAYTKGLEGTPNEIKIKAFADDKYRLYKGAELDAAIKGEVAKKESDLKNNMASQGTTPRRYVDLLGSLMDLTSGSGDKGTPVVWIQNYFDNYSTE